MRRSGAFLLLLLFSFWLTVNQFPLAQACAYEPSYFENETIFFLSSLANDSLFERFYFDERHDRSKTQWDNDILKNRETLNLKEWEKWFGDLLSLDDIRQLVYKVPLSDLQNPDRLKQQRWKTVLMRPEHRAALEYLIFAKRCEPYCVVDRWSWDLEEEMAERRKPAPMLKLLEEAKRRYQSVSSSFFKVRYGYQMVRLAHYVKDYRLCIDLFNQYVAPLPKNSVIWEWAARHRNGALKAMGKKSEALVNTALMFDQNPAMMDEAYLDFYIPLEPVWQECLRLAKDPRQKATLWMLQGLKQNHFNLEPLEEIIKLEPKSSRAEVLLVRYINQLECSVVNSGYFFDNYALYLEEEMTWGGFLLPELLDFIDSVDKTKVRQPALWYAAGGYIHILLRSHEEADTYLAKAESLCPSQNSDLWYQIQLLKLLNQAVKQPKITPEFENKSLAVLQWLDDYKDQPDNRAQIHQAFYTLLGQKYLIHQDFPKAYCMMAKAGTEHDYLLELYPDSAQMNALLDLLSKPNKTPFEQRITTGLPWTFDDYLSVEGTRLLRKGRYAEALAKFSQISEGYWERLRRNDVDLVETSFEQNYYNPRTGLYQYPENGFPRYTKLEFTRKVIELQNLAEKDRANAGYYYYQIANGFFHSPFWGFNGQLWPYSSTIWRFDPQYPFEIHGLHSVLKRQYQAFWKEYGRRKVALEYYVKAMNVTEDPELAAKCCFLAAACMTKFSFYRGFHEPGKGMAYYFDILREKYSKTQYYQQVIEECATLKDYLKKN